MPGHEVKCPKDISLAVILDDHIPLKRCIEILKNPGLSLSSRRSAFNEFVPLLRIHAKAEESVLYNFEKTEIPMREAAFEGDVEHALSLQMIQEVKQAVDVRTALVLLKKFYFK